MRRDGFQYYCWQASRCRELASRQPSADVKAHLVGAAGRYDKLAKLADAQSDRPEPRKVKHQNRGGGEWTSEQVVQLAARS